MRWLFELLWDIFKCGLFVYFGIPLIIVGIIILCLIFC